MKCIVYYLFYRDASSGWNVKHSYSWVLSQWLYHWMTSWCLFFDFSLSYVCMCKYEFCNTKTRSYWITRFPRRGSKAEGSSSRCLKPKVLQHNLQFHFSFISLSLQHAYILHSTHASCLLFHTSRRPSPSRMLHNLYDVGVLPGFSDDVNYQIYLQSQLRLSWNIIFYEERTIMTTLGKIVQSILWNYSRVADTDDYRTKFCQIYGTTFGNRLYSRLLHSSIKLIELLFSVIFRSNDIIHATIYNMFINLLNNLLEL